MSAPHAEELVDEYLGRLDTALAGMPADRREEIVGEMRSHIAEERSRISGETDADLHNLLDRLGDPDEIALAARPPAVASKPTSRSAGPLEILAMVLTPFIWPVGVILYWVSPRWRTRDKVIATVLPPGGYPVVLFLGELVLFLGLTGGGGCSEIRENGVLVSRSCTGLAAAPGWVEAVVAIVAVIAVLGLLVLPVLVGIYMARRLRSLPGG